MIETELLQSCLWIAWTNQSWANPRVYIPSCKAFRPWVSSWPLREANHPRPSKPPEFSLPPSKITAMSPSLFDIGIQLFFMQQAANVKSSNLQTQLKAVSESHSLAIPNLFATSALSSYATIFHGPNLITDLPSGTGVPRKVMNSEMGPSKFHSIAVFTYQIQHICSDSTTKKNLKQHAKIQLVGGWTTHLKNMSQNGNLPQFSGWFFFLIFETAKQFSNSGGLFNQFFVVGDHCKAPAKRTHCTLQQFHSVGVWAKGEKVRSKMFKIMNSWHLCTLQNIWGVSSNGGNYPKNTSSDDHFLAGKPMGLLGKPTILGNPRINPLAKKKHFQRWNQLPAQLRAEVVGRLIQANNMWPGGDGSNTKAKMWVFPTIGVLQNGWFIMENPMKMDDLRVPLFLETPMLMEISDNHVTTHILQVPFQITRRFFLLTLFSVQKWPNALKLLKEAWCATRMHARLDARFDLYRNSRQNNYNQPNSFNISWSKVAISMQIAIQATVTCWNMPIKLPV